MNGIEHEVPKKLYHWFLHNDLALIKELCVSLLRSIIQLCNLVEQLSRPLLIHPDHLIQTWWSDVFPFRFASVDDINQRFQFISQGPNSCPAEGERSFGL